MKITVHWDRVIGVLIAIVVAFIAIILFKAYHRYDQDNHEPIGQCDMHQAQKLIDNLVNK